MKARIPMVPRSSRPLRHVSLWTLTSNAGAGYGRLSGLRAALRGQVRVRLRVAPGTRVVTARWISIRLRYVPGQDPNFDAFVQTPPRPHPTGHEVGQSVSWGSQLHKAKFPSEAAHEKRTKTRCA